MLGKIIALIALPILLGACATTSPIASSDRGNVKSVTLSKNVPIPPKVYYLGPGDAIGLAIPVVGPFIMDPIIEESRESFQGKTANVGASIDKIVYEETLSQIRQSGKFPLRDEAEPGGSTIYVSVLSYGFSIPHGFSSKLVPILGIRYEMKDASGRVVWRAIDGTRPLGNPVESIDADEIRNNAAAREAAWRGAAKALAIKLVATY